MNRPRPLLWYAVPPGMSRALFEEHQLCRLHAMAEVIEVPDLTGWAGRPGLDRLEVILTAERSGRVSEGLLIAANTLRAVVHAGSSATGLVDPIAERRGVRVSCQGAVNAGPVADYAFATIVMALKGAFDLRERYRAMRQAIDPSVWLRGTGIAGRRVGLVGCSASGRLVLERLRTLPVEVFVCEPELTSAQARALGVHLVDDLRELFAETDVVSLHPGQTRKNLISAEVLAAMRDGSTLVNTSEADLVDESALVFELCSGRLSAVLDVSNDDPPPPESPLWDLPNVFFTPHLAGAVGADWHLVGREAVDEVERVLTGVDLRHPITREFYE